MSLKSRHSDIFLSNTAAAEVERIEIAVSSRPTTVDT